MSIKNWILLLLVYVLYLCLGGLIFRALECPNYKENNRKENQRQITLVSSVRLLRGKLSGQLLQDLDTIVNVSSLSNDLNTKLLDDASCGKWNFYNSLFFSFTAVTTIGYGHQAPETNNGRVVCVFYSLLGIPLNLILIGTLASLFSNKVVALRKRASASGTKRLQGLDRVGRVGRVILEGFVWFVIFTSLFLFIPAAIFTYGGLEDKTWDYTDSVYYTFITLSTIGFGDLVAGRQSDKPAVELLFYHLFIIVWIIFGLGYIVGVIDVLVDAFQSSSKPVKRAFRELRNQIHVQDYWKRILNEIISMKEDNGDWMEGELLEGGGSEPCLGRLSAMGSPVKKRSVSTGDLIEVDGEGVGGGGDCANPSLGPADTRQSLQTLNSKDLSSIEELNEDTITSLRHFLTTATAVAKAQAGGDREWIENNIPGGLTLPPTRQVTHTSIKDFYYNTVSNPGDEERLKRNRSLQNRRPNRRQSLVSRTSSFRSTTSATAGPVEQLLERTTLGEFLTAVETVRAKSMAELAVPAEEPKVRRKTSFLGRLTRGNSGTEAPTQSTAGGGGPMTLSQVATLLSFQRDPAGGDGDSITSENPLVRSSSGPDPTRFTFTNAATSEDSSKQGSGDIVSTVVHVEKDGGDNPGINQEILIQPAVLEPNNIPV